MHGSQSAGGWWSPQELWVAGMPGGGECGGRASVGVGPRAWIRQEHWCMNALEGSDIMMMSVCCRPS